MISRLSLPVIAGLVLIPSVRAAVVFSDTFAGVTNWTTGASLTVATGTSFGGASQSYGVWTNSAGGDRSTAKVLLPTSYITTSFDFYEPAGLDVGSFTFGYSILGNASTAGELNGTNAKLAFTIGGGTIGVASNTSGAFSNTAYSTDAVHTITMLYNATGSGTTYGSGVSLAAGALDLYLDGTRLGTFTSTISGTATTFVLRSFSTTSPTNVVYLDNVAINNALVAVPEPSVFGLLGAGVLAAASVVRRRRRNVA